VLTLRRPHLPGANALDKAARAPAGLVKLSAAVPVMMLEVQAAMVVEAEEDEDVAVGVPDEVHTTLFPRASKFRVASLRCP
jgi:hypothetical protein